MAEKAAATKPNATVLSRIKRMMQQDEDVGKVAKSSPVLIGDEFGTASQQVDPRTNLLRKLEPLWGGAGPLHPAATVRPQA